MALNKAKLNKKRLQKLKQWQKRLVDEHKLPNTHVILWRNGQLCYNESTGIRRDGVPIGENTIFRLYSMSKPIVSIALMMLYEEGRFLLSDPLHLYLGPKWKKKNMCVYLSGDFEKGYKTVSCKKTITIKHVLTHTSGLSYGFDAKGIENKVDEIYYKENIITRGAKFKAEKEINLETFIDRLANAPLLFQPGAHYMYGFNTDVCGRLIEVLSGQTLDQFLEERIFKPLKMVDTGFWVPREKIGRFCSMWMPKNAIASMAAGSITSQKNTGLRNINWTDGGASVGGEYNGKFRPNRYLSGGGGLVGTAMDYALFCEMLMLGGKSSRGVRIISNKTLEWMTINHLEKDGVACDLNAITAPGYTETTATRGTGFGLGFSCIIDPAATKQINSKGSFRWGGAASTTFFCDPQENMFCVMMTALRFRNDFTLPLTELLKQFVFGAIDDDPTERQHIRQLRSML